MQVPITFPVVSFIYAPWCYVGTGARPYVCMPTVGDQIRLYSSTDRVTWADEGVVFGAVCGTWEDDGNEHASGGYCTGISNFTVSRSRVTGKLIAAYVAGHTPNGGGSGGIGIAWATDPHGPWTRYVANPILTEPGGMAGNPVLLRVQSTLPSGNNATYEAIWLYSSDDAGHLYRQPIDDLIGVPTGTVNALPSLTGYSPIGWDWGGCWGVVGTGWTDVAAFASMQVYSGGDCATTKGTLVGTVTAASLGHAGIAGLGMIEKSIEGGVLGGPTFLVTAWDSWASQTPPQAVQIGTPAPMVYPGPDAAWAVNAQGAVGAWVPTPTPTVTP